jgi:hypothetical protein
MSFEFSRPLPAAEMRLKCCSTQGLDCKGVYCSAHNVAVPSGIRESESVGPGLTRIRPDTAAGQTRRRLYWHPESSPNQLRRPRQRRPPRWRRRARYRPCQCCHPRRRRRRRPRSRRLRPRRPQCRRHSLRRRRARRRRRRSARRRFNWLQYPEQTQ